MNWIRRGAVAFVVTVLLVVFWLVFTSISLRETESVGGSARHGAQPDVPPFLQPASLPAPPPPRMIPNSNVGPDRLQRPADASTALTKDGVRVEMILPSPENLASVELRFFGRRDDGRLEPANVFIFFVERVKDGILDPVSIEEPSIVSCEAVGYRAPAARFSEHPGFRLWRFGQRYYLRWREGGRIEGRDGPYYEAVIDIPSEIPKGQIWQVTLVSDHLYPTISERFQDRSMDLDGMVAGLDAQMAKGLVVWYWLPQPDVHGSNHTSVSLKDDGSFALKAQHLGGQLQVVERERRGRTWFYIGNVSKRRIRLPEEADVVAKPGDLVPFSLRTPPILDRVLPETVGLLVRPTDRRPVWWTGVPGGAQGESIAVDGEYAPGRYFVVMSERRSEDKPGGGIRVLGTVTIKKGSNANLEPAPLNEAEKAEWDSRQDLKQPARPRSEPQPQPPTPATFKEVDVTIDDFKPAASMHVVYLPRNSSVGQSLRLFDKQRFRLSVPEPGGQLVIESIDPQHGRVWLFVREVRNPILRLPADADIAMSEEELVSFRVRVPREPAGQELRSVGLLADRADRLPIAWALLSDKTQRKTYEEDSCVRLAVIPGNYVVRTIHRVPGNDRADPSFAILGTVNITQDSAGQTLELQPLTEEDKKQLPAQDKPPPPAAAPVPAQP